MTMKNTLFILCIVALLSLPFSFYSAALTAPPGSVMKISIVDKDTGRPIVGAIAVSTASTTDNNQYIVNITQENQEVSLAMPPPEYSPSAKIRASAQGYFDSEEITISGNDYWARVDSLANNVPPKPSGNVEEKTDDYISDVPPVKETTYLLEKRFELKRNPNAQVAGGSPTSANGKSGGICCLPAAIVGLLLVGYTFARKK